MAERSHFYNFPSAILNITPKPDMLEISLFAQTFQSLCLRKRIKLSSTFFYGTYILILKLQETSPGSLAELLISRLVYKIFLFNY